MGVAYFVGMACGCGEGVACPKFLFPGFGKYESISKERSSQSSNGPEILLCLALALALTPTISPSPNHSARSSPYFTMIATLPQLVTGTHYGQAASL